MKSRRGLPSQWSSSPSSSLDPLTDSANTAPRNLPGAAGWDWGGRMTDGRTDFDRYCQLRRESPLTSIESFTRRRRLHLSQISSLVICLPKLHFASISALGISVMINYMNDIPSAETEVNCNLGRRITTCDTTRRQAGEGDAARTSSVSRTGSGGRAEGAEKIRFPLLRSSCEWHKSPKSIYP